MQEIKTHHGSIHTSETFMHGFRFWHHQDLSTHFISPVLSHLPSFSTSFAAPCIRWQVYFHLLLLLPSMFSVIWFKYIGQAAEKEAQFSFIPIIYARTHTRSVCLWYILEATLVSHVLSSFLEIYKTCFSSFEIFSIQQEEVLSVLHLNQDFSMRTTKEEEENLNFARAKKQRRRRRRRVKMSSPTSYVLRAP